MCGIAGIVTRDPEREAGALAGRLTRGLAHRGPDGEGFWTAARPGEAVGAAELDEPSTIVLGHRRLSIVDLAGGAQPMRNEDGAVWVAFNGEIYNQADLRRELQRAGHRFATTADTEVLVHGWEEWRDGLFGRLNGIFAFALADARSREVVLVRDPVGVKPLYVGVDGGRTWWSSELAAAREAGLVEPELSPEALKLFLTFRFVPSPLTIFERVWKVPPGHFVRLSPTDAGSAPAFRSYEARIRSAAEPRGRGAWREAVIAELERSVDRQLMADVPVGCLLSGGVDSSLVTQIMRERLPYAPETFGIGFLGEGARSEAEAARLAAAELGVPHRTVTVAEEAYVGAWPEALRQVGEPIANSSALLVGLLCREVGRTHKVVLSGQGADEPLGGYPRHVAERLYSFGRLAPGLSRALAGRVVGGEDAQRLARVLAQRDRVDRYVEIFSLLPAEEVDTLVPNASGPARELARAAVSRWLAPDGGDDTLNEVLRVDSRMSLADDLLLTCDHASMRSSVELRVPFLDLAFLELVERMPSRYKISAIGSRKWLYREGACRRLPRSLVRRVCGPAARLGRKRGFATPLADWFGQRNGRLADTAAWTRELYACEHFSAAALDDLRTKGLPRRSNSLFSLAMWLDGLNGAPRTERVAAAAPHA